jgi:hypothetical protein
MEPATVVNPCATPACTGEPGCAWRAATWGRREEFRFIHDKFGLGTPRVLLELPRFIDWKNNVYVAASELDLSPKDWKRLEEIFRIFAEHRCRRTSSVYNDVLGWLENAEQEHAQREFGGRVSASVLCWKHRSSGGRVRLSEYLCPASLARVPDVFEDSAHAQLAADHPNADPLPAGADSSGLALFGA